jgi:hypothetical protein
MRVARPVAEIIDCMTETSPAPRPRAWTQGPVDNVENVQLVIMITIVASRSRAQAWICESQKQHAKGIGIPVQVRRGRAHAYATRPTERASASICICSASCNYRHARLQQRWVRIWTGDLGEARRGHREMIANSSKLEAIASDALRTAAMSASTPPVLGLLGLPLPEVFLSRLASR